MMPKSIRYPADIPRIVLALHWRWNRPHCTATISTPFGILPLRGWYPYTTMVLAWGSDQSMSINRIASMLEYSMRYFAHSRAAATFMASSLVDMCLQRPLAQSYHGAPTENQHEWLQHYDAICRRHVEWLHRATRIHVSGIYPKGYTALGRILGHNGTANAASGRDIDIKLSTLWTQSNPAAGWEPRERNLAFSTSRKQRSSIEPFRDILSISSSAALPVSLTWF